MNDFNLNFGSDPEVFAVLERTGEVISPALLEEFSGVSPVIQDKYHPIFIDNKEFSWHMDGVAFELTVKKILKTGKDFVDTFQNSLDSLDSFLSNVSFQGNTLSLFTKPVVPINKELYLPYVIEDTPTFNDKIFQGFIFGCDEDFDAVDVNYKCKTKSFLDDSFRYGGGHFHVSGNPLFAEYPEVSIVFLAMTIGNYFVIKAKERELNKKRVETFGKPFRFRPTKYSDGNYGVEYRSLSNSIMLFEESEFEQMILLSNKASEFLTNKRVDIYEQFLNPTAEAIINYDSNLANKILKELLQK